MKTSYAKLLGVALLLLPAVALNAQQSGTVQTIGGAFAGFTDGDNSVSQFNTPTALALDGAGNLFISDSGNNAIRVMQLSSTQVRTLATVSNPSGIAFDRATNLYVASLSFGNVSKFDSFGNLKGVVLSGLAQPTALAADTNGNLYVSELTGRVRRFTTNGTVTGTYQVTAASRQLRGVAVLDDGRVIVSDSGNHVLWQFAGPGTVPTVYAGTLGSPGFVEGIGIAAKLNGPQQIARGPFDSIVFADRFNHRVRIVDCDRTVRTLFGIDPTQWETFPDPSIFPGWFDGTVDFAESRNPVGLAVSGSGTVYDTETFYHLIREGTGFTFKDCVTGGGTSTNNTPTPMPLIWPKKGFFPEGVFLSVTASNLSGTFGPDIRLYYTLDGSTPNASSPQIPIGIDGIGEIMIEGRVDLGNLKVVAISATGASSPIVQGISADGVNMITLGYETGEASSDFIAAPGQKFVAPVTLSVVPGTTMYGLQFNLKIDPETGPLVPDFELGFESMLMKPTLIAGIFTVIPNEAFTGTADPARVLRTNIVGDATNIFTVEVFPPEFSSMIFVNPAERLLGAGWVERFGATNLYNTRAHDLIRFSIPHDTMFSSDTGKVVPGGFTFRVPTSASLGQTYIVQIGRPSATGDGVRSDAVIEAPGLDDPSPIKAVRRLTLGIREYIVGDVAPFRWFNAGEFGDGSILNNDITQFQAGIVYHLGAPVSGSDFEDAFDTCCVSTNGTDFGADFNALMNSTEVINQIGFGDGQLTISDMFVAYRRSLDPTLVWYARYWSGGTRQARVVPNTFRGQAGFSTLSTRQFADPEGDQPNGEPMKVRFNVLGAMAEPGQVVELPINVKVSGGVPVRSLLLQAKVETLDGTVPVRLPVEFIPADNLGPASFANTAKPAVFTGAWLDLSRTSVNGESILGTLRITIPSDATPSSAYEVKLENVSASPNGIFHFATDANISTIIMRNRPVNWGDEIPNSWRETFFSSAISIDARLDGDPDQDGATNLAEYKSGTSPVDPGDALKVRANNDQSGVRLSWRSVAGKKYQIEASSDLINGPWEPVGTPKDGSGSELQSTDNSGGGPKFYRVRIVE